MTELSLEKRVSIFPNPTTSFFNLVVSSLEEDSFVFLYDQLGKIVLSQGLPSANHDNFYFLDVSGLSAGTYFMHIQTPEEKLVKLVQISR